MNTEKPKGRQGFASMDIEKARLIQSCGGEASHGGGRPKGSKDKPTTEEPHADHSTTNASK